MRFTLSSLKLNIILQVPANFWKKAKKKKSITDSMEQAKLSLFANL